jgi:membrane protease YdiL (CAAX protease family)
MANTVPSRFNSRLIQIAWIVGVFLVLLTLPDYLVHLLGLTKRIESMARAPFSRQMLLAGLYVGRQALSLAVCVFLVVALYRRTFVRALGDLGLNGSVKLGWLVGLAATLPMPVIFGIVNHASFNASVVLQVLVFGIGSGIAEETLFRGYAFGLLYRRVHVGFWLSIILPTAFFALGHLYQVHGILDSLGILAVTGLGSLWFGWLYVRWEYNLWVPIAMHSLMDSWWTVFDAGSTALGSGDANIARLLTILLSTILTLWHCQWDFRTAFLNIRPVEPAGASAVAETVR